MFISLIAYLRMSDDVCRIGCRPIYSYNQQRDGVSLRFMAQITAVNIPWAQIADFENGRVFLH
jgi:hypothetical protein